MKHRFYAMSMVGIFIELDEKLDKIIDRSNGEILITDSQGQTPIEYVTPTDEDAKRRPTVEVRDRDEHKWGLGTLLTVIESSRYPFYCLVGNEIVGYKQCRMKKES